MVDMLARSSARPSGLLRAGGRDLPLVPCCRGQAEALIPRPAGKVTGRVEFYVALICFPVIFLGELPDKTMFASLVLSARSRPLQVWLGAAAAFTVHVAIAVTAGVALFALVPRRYLDVVVAGLFAAGAVYIWVEGTRADGKQAPAPAPARGAILTAFVVIFLAEWGDLTQILTANLAARYHEPLPVAAGALLALWAVAALAVVSGQALLRFVSISAVRKITAVALAGLAAYAAWSAYLAWA
jgi:Ca2+/H+ antiporter, TMEM165/GDT1 family